MMHHGDDHPRPPFLTIALASVGGAGWSPVAPGTAGSLVALVLYWFIPWLHDWRIAAVAIVLVVAIGIPAATAMERWRGPDPSAVVLDELAGQWLTLLLIPLTWKTALAGFLLFRILDIVKLPPARQFDAMPGGVGIMLDDVAAGVQANIILHAVVWLLPWFAAI